MPKELTLPCREDVRQLPRWGRVALAARAVRRVQPQFALDVPEATSRQLDLVEQAISLAERAAKECFESDHPFVAKMKAASTACEKLAKALIEPSATAAWVALGAARVADAARIACSGNRLLVVDHAMSAIVAATEAVGIEAIQKGLHKDWQKLLKRIEQEECDKDTPFPAKVFGSI
jgi:hypothetical protein